MDKLIILVLALATLAICIENVPAVYEDNSVNPTENVRLPRQSNLDAEEKGPKYEQHVFSYDDTAQQDPLKLRYAKQQQAVAKNVNRTWKNTEGHVINERDSSAQDQKVISSPTPAVENSGEIILNDTAAPLENQDIVVLSPPVVESVENVEINNPSIRVNAGKNLQQLDSQKWRISDPEITHRPLTKQNFSDYDKEEEDSAEIERLVNQIDLMKNSYTRPKKEAPRNATTWQKVETIPNNKRSTSQEVSDRMDKSANESTASSNRQDVATVAQIVYVPQSALGLDSSSVHFHQNQQRPQGDLVALNALLGQNPQEQLYGLQQLLNQPDKNARNPVIQGPRPFQLNTGEVKINTNQGSEKTSSSNQVSSVSSNELAKANQNSQSPMVAYQSSDLAKIQAQLDASAAAQANFVLAQAQQDSIAHVEAQHMAIIAAQQQAEREALAQIEAQNHGMHHTQPVVFNHNLVEASQNPLITLVNVPIQAHQPQALPLIAEPLQQVPQLRQQLPTLSDVVSKKIQQAPTPFQQHSGTIQFTSQDALANKQIQQQPKEFGSFTNNGANTSKQQFSSQNTEHVIVPYRSKGSNQALNLLHAQRAVLEHMQSNNIAQAQKVNFNIQQHNPVMTYSFHQSHPLITVPKQPTKFRPEQETKHRQSFTKPHSPKQGRQVTPSAYQEVIFNSNAKPFDAKQVKREEHQDHHEYAARYAFGYKVKDFHKGSDFGHEEAREGKSTKGRYHVLLPDGRMQKVDYYADPTGYHAKVSYENLAHHL